MSVEPQADEAKRRRANIRVVIILLVIAVGIYLGFILMNMVKR